MKAFLSHSSADKDLVVQVHAALSERCTWLDRAEIEWGELFLERIADGITSATDFVLFWSKKSARSEWVRLEINMAFVQALRRKAIRLRVVILDDTPLPLYLQPYHVLSVAQSESPLDEIVEALSAILAEIPKTFRSRFVNRNEEIGRIESAVDDPDTRVGWLFGFTGVGKAAVLEEALSRIFETPQIARIEVTQGTGAVELALSLNASTGQKAPAEGLDAQSINRTIREAVELLATQRKLLVLTNVQYWLDENSEPVPLLKSLLDHLEKVPSYLERPAFLTSTRRPVLGASVIGGVIPFRIAGLSDEHMVTLIRNWHSIIHVRDLSIDDARIVAPRLYGHPAAARLAAGLLGDHSANFLDEYPQQLVALRRDLGRTLLRDLALSDDAERLMEILALAGGSLPPQVIVATGFTDEQFQQSVAQCASAGLITAGGAIETHPLFRDFYWHHLHRGDYQSLALRVATATEEHLKKIEIDTPVFTSLLLTAFRSYAMGGQIGKARLIRSDLVGELESAAITLYNRRSYDLADEYVSIVLDSDPTNWRMRLYQARIRIRQERWSEADEILSGMLSERNDDTRVKHAIGWRHLRQKNFAQALSTFIEIVAQRDHVASLRDGAECLHRLGRNPEALEFLKRAKRQESENPFVLDLESRILEDLGQLNAAYDAALLASARDPHNANMQNRLGLICSKLRKGQEAVEHFTRAIELDADLFNPANSLVGALLDEGDLKSAQEVAGGLEQKSRTPRDRDLLRHTQARVLLAAGDLDESGKILEKEILANHNIVANWGLSVQLQCKRFDNYFPKFPALAGASLASAEQALVRISEIDPANDFLSKLRGDVETRQNLLASD